jgi:hypothetical protein
MHVAVSINLEAQSMGLDCQKIFHKNLSYILIILNFFPKRPTTQNKTKHSCSLSCVIRHIFHVVHPANFVQN